MSSPKPKSTDEPTLKSRLLLWWPRARTLFWIALISVIIWVWADLERTEEASFTITVRVAPGDNRLRIVTPDPNERVEVTVALAGTRRSLDDFRQQIAHQPVEYTYVADREWAREPGEHLVDLVETLNDWGTFRSRGITVRSVTPSPLRIDTDEWVPIRAIVEPRLENADVQEVSVEASPIEVWVPKSRQADVGDNPKIETRLTDLADLPIREEPQSITAELSDQINGVPVKLNKDVRRRTRSVQVVLRIGQRTDKLTMNLNVELATTPSLHNDMVDRRLDFIPKNPSDLSRSVTLIGPASEIEKLRRSIDERRPAGVHALLTLTDKHRADLRATAEPVTIILPPGLRIEGEFDWKIDFTLEQAVPGLPG